MKPEDAPRLTEWVTASEAADLFQISRQAVNKMIQAGEFRSLHKIGPDTRPQYVLGRDEVRAMQEARLFRASSRRQAQD